MKRYLRYYINKKPGFWGKWTIWIVLFIYLFIYSFICLFIYLFICLFTYLFTENDSQVKFHFWKGDLPPAISVSLPRQKHCWSNYPEVFCQKSWSRKFCQIYTKTTVLESLFKKLFFQNTTGRLLLVIGSINFGLL